MNINYFYLCNELIIHYLNLEQKLNNYFRKFAWIMLKFVWDVLGTISSLYPVDIRRLDCGTILNKFVQWIHFYS